MVVVSFLIHLLTQVNYAGHSTSMEVREQFAEVGSVSTMWDLGTEFRLSSLVASSFTY